MPLKKKNKRSSVKYPALQPNLNLKTRQELIDYDYVNKLSESEKAWLNKFTEEYVGASLDRVNFDNNIHNTKKLKQDCDRRNNKRKEDAYTLSKVSNMLFSVEDAKIEMRRQEELLEEFEDLEHTNNNTNSTSDTSTDESDDL